MVTPKVPFFLESLGLTKDQSYRWQKTAIMPETKFEVRVAEAKKGAIFDREYAGPARVGDRAGAAHLGDGADDRLMAQH